MRRFGLDSILTSASGTELGAFVAGSFDDKPVISSPKSVEFCHGFAELQQLRTGEFNQFPAFRAVQMVVLGISVVVFINTAAVQFESIEKARIHKLPQRSIDSWAGDIVRGTFGRELLHQLIGIKMLMPIENLFDEEFPLFRVS